MITTDVLKYMLINTDYQELILSRADNNFFSDSLEKIIFESMYEFTTLYQKPIKLKDLDYMIKKKEIDDNMKEKFLHFSNSIKNLNDDNAPEFEMMKNDTEELFISIKIQNYMKNNIEKYQTPGTDMKELRQKLLEEAQEMATFSFEDTDTLSSSSVFDRMKDYFENVEENGFLTSSPRLNSFVENKGGFKPKTLTCFMAPPHTGKCVTPETEIKVRYKDKYTEIISIEELFNRSLNNREKTDIINDKKFQEVYELYDYEIWSYQGFVKCDYISKTIPYQKWEVILEDGKKLVCADNHIVKTLRGNIAVKDLKTLEQKEHPDTIRTEQLYSEVLSVKRLEESVSMYDIQIEENVQSLEISKDYDFSLQNGISINPNKLKKGDWIEVRDSLCEIKNIEILENIIKIDLDFSEHTYYTNGILSHNTLMLTSIFSDALKNGKKVLYISTEMSEEEIMERVFSNLLEIKMDDLKDEFEAMKEAMKDWEENYSSFHIKTFPSGMCSHMTIRNILNTLRSKEGFLPDVIIIDQLTTMISSIKTSNLYENGKDIVSGVKGIMQEYNAIGFTASQANREGSASKDGLQMKDSAESWAIPQIVDVLIGATKRGNNSSIHSYNYQLRFDWIKNRIAGMLGTSHVDVDSNYMRFI